MKTSKFPEMNAQLLKPEDMTDEQCSGLPIFTDGQVCVSLWRPSIMERLTILFTGRIWLGVLSGRSQPPVWVNVKHPFEKPTAKPYEKQTEHERDLGAIEEESDYEANIGCGRR